MKGFKNYLVLGLIISLGSMVFLTGCFGNNQSGLTVDEPEITVEYLQNEYAEQLIRDGAEHVFGNISLSTDDDGNVNVHIKTKEFVEDDSQPNGFYIEDRNYEMDSVLAEEARCVFMAGGVSLPSIMNTSEFVTAYNADLEKYSANGNEEYAEYKLYDMYIMGDQVVLLIEKYIP